MRVETKIYLNKFKLRDYQKPIYDALENKKYKKILYVMPRRCISENTHITLANGSTKHIQDIQKGDRILSFDGEKINIDSVKNCWKTGPKKALKIKSHKFPDIITSYDHKFFSNNKWLKASELKNNTKIFQQNKICSNKNNPLMAEIIGFLTHDGYVSRYQQPKFTNKNIEILKRVEYLIKELFDYDVIWRKKGNCFDLGISNGTKGGGTTKNKVKELFRSHGLDIPKSKKRIHPLIWELDKESILVYLRAIISCDGNIYLRKEENRIINNVNKYIKSTAEVTISCGSSYWLAFDTYWLLRKIGFIPQTPKFERESNWKIKIGRSNEIIEILSEQIYGKQIKECLKNLSFSQKSHTSCFNNNLFRVNRHVSQDYKTIEMYDLETENNHNFFANGYLVHNSGKDITAWNLTIRQAIKRIGVYYYIFPTYAQGKKALWDSVTIDGVKFIDFIPPELITTKNSQEMKIVLTNGSLIQIVGSDNIDRLVGTNPCGCVFSEFALQDPKAYQLIRPILIANNGFVLIESTPRGKNHFYELYQIAQNASDWFCYHLTLDDTKHIDPQEIEKDIQQGIMSRDLALQEYYCDFNLGVEGSYYAKYIDRMRLNNQISDVPWEPDFPVYTAWDLGMRDSTIIIFFQKIGQIVRIIDVGQGTGKGLEHYAKFLATKPYTYGKHFAPHDIKVRELGTGLSRLEKARNLGIEFVLTPNLSIEDGIESVRSSLAKIWIDDKKCETLIKALEQYRKEYDSKRKIYKDRPLHDWTSHYADAVRMLCLSLPKTRDSLSAKELEKRYQSAVYGKDNSFDDIFDKRFNPHY